MPTLPNPADRGGFALDLWLTPGELAREQVIFSTRNRFGKGFTLSLLPNGAARITLSDRVIEDLWESDPGLLTPGNRHHLVVSVDGGPKIITFVVDGVLCDGGADRPKGWHRFPFGLGDLNGLPDLTIDAGLTANVHALRIYDRYLRTSEAVGNFSADPKR